MIQPAGESVIIRPGSGSQDPAAAAAADAEAASCSRILISVAHCWIRDQTVKRESESLNRNQFFFCIILIIL